MIEEIAQKSAYELLQLGIAGIVILALCFMVFHMSKYIKFLVDVNRQDRKADRDEQVKTREAFVNAIDRNTQALVKTSSTMDLLKQVILDRLHVQPSK